MNHIVYQSFKMLIYFIQTVQSVLFF